MPTKGVPFTQAIKTLKQKANIPTKSWDDMLKEPHAKGFAVAGATSMALLGDLHSAINHSMENGTTLADFRKDFDKIVAGHGWQYKGSKSWRTKVIFNTNKRTAYASGRWQQYQANKKRRPYLQYLTAGDGRVRAEHAKWDKIILPINDPFWDTHYPPNGWGCRCSTRSLSENQLKSAGLTPAKQAPAIEYTPRVNAQTGEVYPDTPQGIDTGWDYNVGKAWLGPDNALGQHILKLPPKDLVSALQQNKAYLKQLETSFKPWAKNAIETYSRAEDHAVGLLDAEVLINLIKAKEPVISATIFIDDRRLKRMVRPSKQKKGITLPAFIVENLPKAIREADAVFLERANEHQKTKPVVIYAIKLNDGRVAKLVMELGYSSKAGSMGNSVISGGVVEARAFGNASKYELIKGSL